MASTKEQRSRQLVIILDEKIDYIKQNFLHELRYDRIYDTAGLKTREFAWLYGDQELHICYHELKEVRGSANFRIRIQPFSLKGVTDNWQEINSIGELDGHLRNIKRAKVLTASDIKAQKNTNKHHKDIIPGLILAGLSGSQAYGLSHNGYTDPTSGEWVEPSDVDIRGVFVLPTKEILSLGGHTKIIEHKNNQDSVFNEIQEFIELCLKCNPERLEMLSVARKNPVIVKSEIGDFSSLLNLQARALVCEEAVELVENQDLFLTKQVIKTYGGYAKQQLYRIESKADRKTKPAMHLIRLMITGIRALKEGFIDCDMTEYKDQLMAIRTGEMSLEDVFKWHRELEEEFSKAAVSTKLPEKPDYEKANSMLLNFRKNNLSWI